MQEIGLYIHFPFCLKKCPYCNFNSIPLSSYSILEDYVKAIIKEIEQKAREKTKKIKTIYVGGGTPTLLSTKNIEKIFKIIFKHFLIRNNLEITIEALPLTFNLETLKVIYNIGINRLSLGVQAFQDFLLKSLGRNYSSSDILKSYHLIRKAGFNNVCFDLMFGLPYQAISDWEETLIKTIELNPEHISTYALAIEKGTNYATKYHENFSLSKENEELKMYELAIKYAKSANYTHYEISNFSKKGKETQHNQIYWYNEEYLGIGAGAYSYIDKVRYFNVKKPKVYIESIFKNKNIVAGKEKLDLEKRIKESIILRLRLIKGINISQFNLQYNLNIEEKFKSQIERMKNLGLLKKTTDSLCLTKKGIIFSNEVFMEFL